MGPFSNSLAAPSRVVILVAAALFTLAVFGLALSAFRSDVVTTPIKWALAIVAAIALARPRDGLLVLAGFVPFGQIAARYFGTEMRGAEALVLAGLAGALVRAWASGRVRRFPSGPIETAALLFGLVVAASAVEQLWFLQIQRNFPAEFLLDLGSYVGGEYLWTFRGFGAIANAMLLLEGLALLVWVIECARGDAAFRERLLRILVVSAAGAALLNPVYAIQELIAQPAPSRGVLRFLVSRWTVHVGDVNAAGSYFSLMVFLAGGLVALRGRRGGLGWLLLAALIAIGGVWITGSRAAFAAVLLVLAGFAGWVVLQRTWRPLPVLAGALLLSVPLWYAVAYRLSFRTSGERSLAVRLEMMRSAMGMISAHPVFGVGIGQYALWSRQYATAALTRIYRLRENAHNNFVQIAGETGLVGFGSFLWVLAVALREAFRASRTDLLARASVLGLAAFLITWLSGHPLLVPAVAYPFWIVLGMATSAGLGPRSDDRARGSIPLALAALLLLVSLPVRLEGWKATVNWDRVSYGFHTWETGPSGERFRWTGPRARIHVPAGATHVTLRLRGNAVSPDNPMFVTIVADGQPAGEVRIENLAWQSARVALAPSDAIHVIDILPSRSWVPAEVFAGNTDTRRLGVQVAELSMPDAP